MTVDDFPSGTRVQVGNWPNDSLFVDRAAHWVDGKYGTVKGYSESGSFLHVQLDVPEDRLLDRDILIVAPRYLRVVDDNTPLF